MNNSAPGSIALQDNDYLTLSFAVGAFVLTSSGNVFAIAGIFKKATKTFTVDLVATLIVLDILIGLLLFVPVFSAAFKSHWFLNSSICHAQGILLRTFTIMSILVRVGLSIERVYFSMYWKGMNVSERVRRCIICMLLVLSASLSGFPQLRTDAYSYFPGLHACDIGGNVSLPLFEFVTCIVPSVLILVFTVLSLKKSPVFCRRKVGVTTENMMSEQVPPAFTKPVIYALSTASLREAKATIKIAFLSIIISLLNLSRCFLRITSIFLSAHVHLNTGAFVCLGITLIVQPTFLIYISPTLRQILKKVFKREEKSILPAIFQTTQSLTHTTPREDTVTTLSELPDFLRKPSQQQELNVSVKLATKAFVHRRFLPSLSSVSLEINSKSDTISNDDESIIRPLEITRRQSGFSGDAESIDSIRVFAGTATGHRRSRCSFSTVHNATLTDSQGINTRFDSQLSQFCDSNHSSLSDARPHRIHRRMSCIAFSNVNLQV